LEYVLPRVLPTLAIGGWCIALQKSSPSIREQGLWTRDSWLNSHYAVAAIFVFSHLNVVAIYLVLVGAARLFDAHPGESADLAALPLAMRVFLALVLIDLIAYWMHRGFHHSALWRIHAIHHSSRELDWLSSTRFHPIDRMLVMATQVGATVLVFGFSLEVAAAAVVIRSTYGLLVHSNLNWTYGRLGYLLVSPAFHRWHHTQEQRGLDRNFAGVFSIFDHLFGTAYDASHEQPQRFGTADYVGENFVTQLASPFVSRPRLARWSVADEERRCLATEAANAHARTSPVATLDSATQNTREASLPSMQ
jgi:sterol desaturase/sphingolipid hydroxylase (fatty acid hydroxylase superfamily)